MGTKGLWSDRAAARRVRWTRWLRAAFILPFVLGFALIGVLLTSGTANQGFAHDLKVGMPFYATVTAVGHHVYDGSYVDVTVNGRSREVDYPDDIPGVQVGDSIAVVNETNDPTRVLSVEHDVSDNRTEDDVIAVLCILAAVLLAGTYLVVPWRGHRAMRRTRRLAPATTIEVTDTGRVRHSWRGIGDLCYRRVSITLDVGGQVIEVHGVRFRNEGQNMFPWLPEPGEPVRVSIPAGPGDWVVVVSTRGKSLMPTVPASRGDAVTI